MRKPSLQKVMSDLSKKREKVIRDLFELVERVEAQQRSAVYICDIKSILNQFDNGKEMK